jgi:hypothetical protein
MTISGKLVDSLTRNPIPGAAFQVFYNAGDMSNPGPPNGTFTSGPDGSFTYVDASLDTAPQPVIQVDANGYFSFFAPVAFWTGNVAMDPVQNTVTTSVPTWVWIIAVILLIAGLYYTNKKFKFI